MIRIEEKAKCCGCTACKTVCPMHCISMESDDEGFLYPIVDQDKCIQCRKCENVCPILNATDDIAFSQDGYLIRSRDPEIRRTSAAGGAFSPIAEYVIEQDGFVCGVYLNEQFRAEHIVCKDKENLFQFRGSKYMQSELNEVFSQILSLLEEKKLVLFSGTPCQVEGLLNAVKKPYDNLITVDVVCHSVPSPVVFDKYIQYIESKYQDKIISVRFRDKHYGYDYPTMKLTGQRKGEFYHHGMESDPWLRAFFSGRCDRPSCYKCVFKKQYRRSDISIWDCHNAEQYTEHFRDSSGTTKVLVHSGKGKQFFSEIRNRYDVIAVTPEKLVDNSPAMLKCVPLKETERVCFFQDMQELSGSELIKKYFPLSLKVQVMHIVRVGMYRMGIQQKMKKLYHKIRR